MHIVFLKHKISVAGRVKKYPNSRLFTLGKYTLEKDSHDVPCVDLWNKGALESLQGADFAEM